MKKYEQDLLKYAENIDSFTDSSMQILEDVNNIIKYQNTISTKSLLKKISFLLHKYKDNENILKVINSLKRSLFYYYGYISISEICKEEDKTKDINLETLLIELNSLVGLKNVKNKVEDLISYQKIQKEREKNKLKSIKTTLHLSFTGNPGTGKTTVARIIGKMYKEIGLLTKGHFLEASRTDLIAGYQGQTALKVKKLIENAKGGVLFIDEAYSITENSNSDSYGRECLTELTKALEDNREDLVVIVAGYTSLMKNFFESNPGLKSRFNTFIEFEDYTSLELKEILISFCKNDEYELEKDTVMLLDKYFENLLKNKEENFSNARTVRNFYNNLIMEHAKRVVKIENPTKEELFVIKKEDFINVVKK